MLYDKFPVVLLSTIASQNNDSTNKHIAKTIIENREKMNEMGISDLAELCHVGTGSISRFCREIGLENFSELKKLIVHFHQDNFEKIVEGNVLDSLENRIQQSVSQSIRSVDLNQIRKLNEDILRYQKVYAAGLLKAQSAATNMQVDFLMMGKLIDTNVSYREQIAHIAEAEKDELIIIFSYTGSYFDYPDFRQHEKHLLLPKIWMVCGTEREVPWFVDETITFDSLLDQIGHPYQLDVIESMIAQLYAQQKQVQ